MKNLILTCAMMIFFGSAAMAQDTPQKTKQSKSTSDTIVQKKSKKNTTTYKTDTIKKQHKNKSKSTSPSTRKDTIGKP
jgi:hypothetical protein